MRTFADRLDAIRDKPHHVRRQVAFLASGVITGVIAVGWLGASLYTGAFALKGANFAEVTGVEPVTEDSGSAFDTGVAGVAAAAAAEEDTVAPGLNVVSGGGGGGSTADPSSPKSGQNIIPF